MFATMGDTGEPMARLHLPSVDSNPPGRGGTYVDVRQLLHSGL